MNLSNKEKSDNFRDQVKKYIEKEHECSLECEYPIRVGFGNNKKSHSFDLGNERFLVECKCVAWTSGGNIPAGKISTLNEAMLYFCATPDSLKKMLFVPKTAKKGKYNSETLAEYYMRSYAHLIPITVEVWELDEVVVTAVKMN